MATKKKRKLFDRLISWTLIGVILVCVSLLVPQLYEIYREWAAKRETTQLVVQDEYIEPNWEELKKLNPDIIGWIYVPKTNINYPIVQAKDNDYYLYRDVKQAESTFGSIFMDYRSSSDYSDVNTIIYGHSVAGYSTMFTQLNQFLKSDFFAQVPNFYILTPSGNYQAQVLSVNRLLDGSDVYQREFYSDQAVLDLVESIKANADQRSNVEFSAGDKMITLSTCDLAYGLDSPNRITVSAKLVPYSEKIVYEK